MQTFTLKPGLVISKNDHFYRLMRYNLQGNAVFQDENSETLVVSRKSFFEQYATKEIQIPKEQPSLGILPNRTVASPDLSFYPKPHADEALRRRRYLDALTRGGSTLPSDMQIKKILNDVQAEISDGLPAPSVSTVRRWHHSLVYSGNTVGLLPHHDKKGRTPVITGELEDLLEDVLTEIWLKEEDVPLTHIYRELNHRILDLNRFRSENHSLVIPSAATVYRYVSRLDPEFVCNARKGKHAANREFRSATGTVDAKMINNRWEIDHTPLDVLLVDEETGKVIGRPWLTVVLDRESRMIMGYLLHLMAPSLESVLRVIEAAIRPKEDVLAKNPSITGEWPCHGFPLRIVPDNAAEFHANNLIDGFAEIGVEVLFPPSRSPKHKGAVERFFRTLAKDFIHTLPGTTFSNTVDRGDYPSEAKACFTLEALDKNLLFWIVEIYHQKPHRGLAGKSPIQHWKALHSIRPMHLPVDLDDLEAMLAFRDERKFHHYGVEVSGIKYNSDELQRILRRSESSDRIEVRYRDELGYVWVKDLDDEVFIRVPAIDGRYQGLSRDLFKAARKHVKKTGDKADSYEKIMKAYRKIREGVSEEKQSQKMRQRRNAAAVSLNKGGKVRQETIPEIDEETDKIDFDVAEADVPMFEISPMKTSLENRK